MTDSIVDPWDDQVRKADANMQQAIEVARWWEELRDRMAYSAHDLREWMATRRPLPDLPMPPAPAPQTPIAAREWQHAPTDPEASRIHRVVAETVPDQEVSDADR